MKAIARCIKILALVTFIAVSLAGCNTVEGFGEDVERGGEELKEAAD